MIHCRTLLCRECCVARPAGTASYDSSWPYSPLVSHAHYLKPTEFEKSVLLKLIRNTVPARSISLGVSQIRLLFGTGHCSRIIKLSVILIEMGVYFRFTCQKSVFIRVTLLIEHRREIEPVWSWSLPRASFRFGSLISEREMTIVNIQLSSCASTENWIVVLRMRIQFWEPSNIVLIFLKPREGGKKICTHNLHVGWRLRLW